MPLALFHCYIEETINLREATAPGVYLYGCHILSLEAVQLRTTGNVDLRAFTARDEVTLAGARIDGQLSLKGSSLTGKHGPALNGPEVASGRATAATPARRQRAETPPRWPAM